VKHRTWAYGMMASLALQEARYPDSEDGLGMYGIRT